MRRVIVMNMSREYPSAVVSYIIRVDNQCDYMMSDNMILLELLSHKNLFENLYKLEI